MNERTVYQLYGASAEYAVVQNDELRLYRWGNSKPIQKVQFKVAPRLVVWTHRYIYGIASNNAQLEALPRRANEPRQRYSLPLQGVTTLIVPDDRQERLWLCYDDGRIAELSLPNDRSRTLFQLQGRLSAYTRLPKELLLCDARGTLYRVQNNAVQSRWSIGNWGASQLDVAPNTRQLLTVGAEGIIRIWKLDTRQPVVTTIGHRRGVRAGAFLSDQQWLTVGDDRLTLLWHIDRPQQPQAKSLTPFHTQVILHRTANKVLYLLTDEGLYQWQPNQWQLITQWSSPEPTTSTKEDTQR